MDLLLVDGSNVCHYLLINSLLNLMRHIQKKKLRYYGRGVVCCSCFHTCKCAGEYRKHLSNCLRYKAGVLNMPTIEKRLQFTNWKAHWFASVVTYFDLESLVEPVILSSDEVIQNTEATKIIHLADCLMGLQHYSQDQLFVLKERSENCLKNIPEALQLIANGFWARRQSRRYFKGYIPVRAHEVASCWI